LNLFINIAFLNLLFKTCLNVGSSSPNLNEVSHR